MKMSWVKVIFPVDLKPWELLDEDTRKKVGEEGVVLHGKE